jgi:pilus assembly protein CpaE
MKDNTVCLHNLDDLASYELPGLVIVARTKEQTELFEALGVSRPRVLILDLDQARAADIIIRALELVSNLCVIGVTDQSNPQAMVEAVRAGCKQLATKPVDPNDLIVAVRRGLNESTEPRQAGHIIGVMSAIGGAGGTTVACHLAQAFADTLESGPLLMDMDLEFGGVARALDIAPSFSIADLAGSGTVDDVLVRKATCEIARGISVLARPNRIDEAHAIDDTMIRMIVQCARGMYPFVILDLPRKLDAVVGAALEECSRTLIITQATVPAIDNAKRLAEALTKAGMDSTRIDFVLNRHRKNIHTLTPEVIEQNLGRKLLCTIPNDFKAVSSALDLGTPVTADNPVYHAISELACKLAGRAPRKETRSWLARIGMGRKTTAVS